MIKLKRFLLLVLLGMGALIHSLPAFETIPAPASGAPFPVPSGEYDYRIEKSLLLPMRDGVRLSTDLYFPSAPGERLPVILVRTPYGKAKWRGNHPLSQLSRMFASHGFIVAVQDKRGRFESEGEYSLSYKDDVDGYDTVEWLSKQDWSNGRIGTYGCSDLGDAQVWLAQTRHPNLAAMVPQASGSSLGAADERYRYFGAFNGGAFHLGAAANWMIRNGSKVFWGPPSWLPEDKFREIADHFEPRPVSAPSDYDINAVMRSLPVIDMLDGIGHTYTDWRDILSHPLTDEWWKQFPYFSGDESVNVPSLFVNSWHDFGVNETLYLFNLFKENAASERARNNQFVIISPTTHCDSELISAPTIVGERELGDARLDFWSIYLAWFDYWLKGIESDVLSMPKVQYYVMGLNEWKGADAWPIPGTRFIKYYLRGEGAANSRFGDGGLSTEPPKSEPLDRYTYDPASPVPSGSGPYSLGEGFFDQRNVESRNDVLVYTSEVLDQGMEVTGPLKVQLYVTSSTPDTDFTAKLVDVYPDGRAFYVQEGILRARYREGFDSPQLMEPDQIYPVTISLDATSNYFGKGHRIRLEVSSSNFPRFDRNLNTGGDNFTEKEWIPADIAIHHSANTQSHIVLPVVPERTR